MGVSEVPIIASGLKPKLSEMPLSQVQSVLRLEAADPGKVRLCGARYMGADSEMVDYTSLMPDPDGEAASNSGDTSPDGVKAHIEKTIDHLQHHRVTDAKQFGDLKKAVEQADRTSGQSNAAIGRAIRTMPANALRFSR